MSFRLPEHNTISVAAPVHAFQYQEPDSWNQPWEARPNGRPAPRPEPPLRDWEAGGFGTMQGRGARRGGP